jgi:O-antigen ligase
MNSARDTDRAARALIGFGLVSTWWIAYFPLPLPEFYKEWVFAVALGAGTLLLGRSRGAAASVRHPLIFAACAVAIVLLIQALAMDGVWPKAVQMACYAGFFVFAVLAGRTLSEARAAQSLEWLAGCLIAAALGSCFFAALQLNLIDFSWPLLAPRSGGRVSGNTAQGNHFADLLWLACFATAFANARGRLGTPTAWLTIVTLQTFAVLSASRMAWVFAAFALLLGGWVWLRRPSVEVRRLAVLFMSIGCSFIVVAAAVSLSGALEWFGIQSSGERIASTIGVTATSQRVWFWQAGLDAALQHPVLGIGAGQYQFHAHELALRLGESPTATAMTNAHNLFVHLGAELGIPLALIVAICVVAWVLPAWRSASKDIVTLAVLAFAGVIFVHANLEYPLWYTYFLGTLGLLVGHLPNTHNAGLMTASTEPASRLGQAAALGVVLVAFLAYLQFRPLENAMQMIVAQVSMGAPPQPDPTIDTTLTKIPAWSPYRDYAEIVKLATALPTTENAAALALRCEKAWGAVLSTYVMARCATAFQVAGQAERATYFAEGICKRYPRAVGVLIDSMLYVERVSPSAGHLQSSCVERRQ